MAIRNQRLAAGTLAGVNTEQVLFTVPAGDVVLLKSVLVRNHSGGARSYNVGLKVGASGANCDVLGKYSPATLGDLASDGVQGWWALNGLDHVYFFPPALCTFDFWLSGALLST